MRTDLGECEMSANKIIGWWQSFFERKSPSFSEPEDVKMDDAAGASGSSTLNAGSSVTRDLNINQEGPLMREENPNKN